MSKIFVAGRIEFLGKHTDYCGGCSLVCAIEKGFYVNYQLIKEKQIKLINEDRKEVVSIELIENNLSQTNHWTNYPQTVVTRITQNFKSRELNGVEIKFRSDLPQAAGVSSSSALVVAVFLAISKANDLSEFDEYKANITNNLELSEYLGCIENGQNYKDLKGEKGVGTFGGSQDHTAILCGKKHHLSRFSFSPVRHEKDFSFPEDLIFVIASSGIGAEKTGLAKEKYNRLSLTVREIVKKFDRNISLAQIIEKYGFEQVKVKLADQELINRLTQFYIESFEIIPKVSNHLAQNEISKIGELIDLSHQNAGQFLANQTPETNFLQKNAREIGALASSAFGAGFGGSLYALVKKNEAEFFQKEWQASYLKKFPQHTQKSEFFITQAGESKF